MPKKNNNRPRIVYCSKNNFHNTKLPDRDKDVNKKIDDPKVNSEKPKK
jgi:hypothetical protein